VSLTLCPTHFIQGDARDLPLADKSVQSTVTSPPYWGLRDYGHAGQIGLEPTLAEYIAVMVAVFREVRRVLRDDGTLWLNMGDGYANVGKWGGSTGGKHTKGLHGETGVGTSRRDCDRLKPKDLMMQPHRLAIALQDDGWYVRMDNVWAKPNPMPESVTDRPTKAHEYVFLLSKSERYYYDAEAVKEPMSQAGIQRQKYGFKEMYGNIIRVNGHRDSRQRSDAKSYGPEAKTGGGRNLRSVWAMTTRPCKEAHFATFPIDLPLRCLKAGTSEKGCCPTCGAPWKRVVEKYRSFESGSGRSGNLPIGKNGPALQGGGETIDVRRGPTLRTVTTHWLPTCKCPAHEPVPCTVLDPFGGAATTALAASELGRRCIIVERKWDYIDIGRARLANHKPGKPKAKRVIEPKPEPTLFSSPLAPARPAEGVKA
jgi:DNA modification methylase